MKRDSPNEDQLVYVVGIPSSYRVARRKKKSLFVVCAMTVSAIGINSQTFIAITRVEEKRHKMKQTEIVFHRKHQQPHLVFIGRLRLTQLSAQHKLNFIRRRTKGKINVQIVECFDTNSQMKNNCDVLVRSFVCLSHADEVNAEMERGEHFTD